MKSSQTEMICFAMKRGLNRVVHISEIAEKDRGSACDCVCLCCGHPLVAKLGHGRKTRHFAHLVEKGNMICSAAAANKTGLHKMAKELICKSTYIRLPEVMISEQCDPDRNMEYPNQQEPLRCGRRFKLCYQNAKLEVPFEGFKSDVCIWRSNGPFLIEIAVTHYVDSEKYNRIKMERLPTVEINIAVFFLGLCVK